MGKRSKLKCASCKLLKKLSSRGVCGPCYSYHYYHGTLDHFPRSYWKHADLIAELDLCRSRGLSVREAAEKIGVTAPALRQALLRERRRLSASAAPSKNEQNEVKQQ